MKNDFTGTWICRNKMEVTILSQPDFETYGGQFISPELPGHWDENGEYYTLENPNPEYDLMERISEKDLRR